ncbi:hypothetical protein PS2_009379 [Malus domestica]
MAMVTASSHLSLNLSPPLVLRASRFPTNARPPSSKCFPAPMPPVTSASASSRSRKTLLSPFVINNDKFSLDIVEDDDAADQKQQVGNANANETLLYSSVLCLCCSWLFFLELLLWHLCSSLSLSLSNRLVFLAG